jgi:hypothetical protein
VTALTWLDYTQFFPQIKILRQLFFPMQATRKKRKNISVKFQELLPILALFIALF